MSDIPPPVSDQPVLKLLNVESAYGPIKAIRGVSLQVRRGEIATVLGSNGAGKTTILKTISGIIDLRKGSIEFNGQDITARDPSLIVQRGLTHVPEGREVFPLLSVHDNLLMGAYTRTDRDGVASDMALVYGYFPILKERAAQNAGPNLTTDSFVKSLESMTFPTDIFGSPEGGFGPNRRQAANVSRLSQIQGGKWKVVSEYAK